MTNNNIKQKFSKLPKNNQDNFRQFRVLFAVKVYFFF